MLTQTVAFKMSIREGNFVKFLDTEDWWQSLGGNIIKVHECSKLVMLETEFRKQQKEVFDTDANA